MNVQNQNQHEYDKKTVFKRDFNLSHAAGFNGYKPLVPRDIRDTAVVDERFDVPARAKGLD